MALFEKRLFLKKNETPEGIHDHSLIPENHTLAWFSSLFLNFRGKHDRKPNSNLIAGVTRGVLP
jgi:hypothetical protein